MAGQRIGYVRVSTLDQNEKRQLDGQVLDRVFTDKTSGQGHVHGYITVRGGWEEASGEAGFGHQDYEVVPNTRLTLEVGSRCAVS